MDKRCAVEITQVANGFIVLPARRDLNCAVSNEPAMVFDSTERLADWLAVHFAREEQTMNRPQQLMAEERERLAKAIGGTDGSKGGYSASWVEGRSR